MEKVSKYLIEKCVEGPNFIVYDRMMVQQKETVIFQYMVRLIDTKIVFANSTFNRTVRLIESTEY